MKYKFLFFALFLSLFACKSFKNQKTESVKQEPAVILSAFTSETLKNLNSHGIESEKVEESVRFFMSADILALDFLPESNDLTIENGDIVETTYSTKTDTFIALAHKKAVVIDVFQDTLEDGRIVTALALAFKGGNLKNNKYFVFTPNEQGIYRLATFEKQGLFYTEYGDGVVEIKSGVDTILLFTFKKVAVNQKGKKETLKERNPKVKKVTGQKKP